jgi:hypothetical protein
MSEIEPLGLPSPSDEPTKGQADHDPRRSATGQSRQRRTRSVEECHHALDQLPGMVATGVITPVQANAIRGALRDVIAVHQRNPGTSPMAASIDCDMLERLRRDPKLMNAMAPLLTPDQIATLMGDTTDGHRP